MCIKNFLFYAFSTFINSWAARKGPGDVFKTFGFVSLALLATSIPMCERPPGAKAKNGDRATTADKRLDIFGKVNRKFMRDLYGRSKIFRAIA